MSAFDAEGMLRVLHEYQVRFVVIGGIAAVLHGSGTATFDLDITPEADEENLTRLAAALRSIHAEIRTEAETVPFDPHPALLASVTVLNLSTDLGDLDLAVTPAAVGRYPAWAAGAVAMDLDGLVVQVASLEHIIASKEAADRDKDRAALPILRALREEIVGGHT